MGRGRDLEGEFIEFVDGLEALVEASSQSFETEIVHCLAGFYAWS
jgi:hypothetical protein